MARASSIYIRSIHCIHNHAILFPFFLLSISAFINGRGERKKVKCHYILQYIFSEKFFKAEKCPIRIQIASMVGTNELQPPILRVAICSWHPSDLVPPICTTLTPHLLLPSGTLVPPIRTNLTSHPLLQRTNQPITLPILPLPTPLHPSDAHLRKRRKMTNMFKYMCLKVLKL